MYPRARSVVSTTPMRPAAPTRKLAPRKTTNKPQYKNRKLTVKKSAQTPISIKNYQAMMFRPFDKSTRSAALPDNFSGLSIPIALRASFTLTTDANGSAAMQLLPRLDQFSRIDPSITSEIPQFSTLTNVIHPQWSSYLSSSQKWRPLVLATRVNYIGETQLRKGTVSSIVSADNPETAISNWANDHSSQAVTVPVSHKTLQTVSRLYDRPPMLDNSAVGDSVLGNIALGFAGLPVSTACIRVDTIFYIEIVPSLDSALSHSSKPSPTGSGFTTGTVVSSHSQMS